LTPPPTLLIYVWGFIVVVVDWTGLRCMFHVVQNARCMQVTTTRLWCLVVWLWLLNTPYQYVCWDAHHVFLLSNNTHHPVWQDDASSCSANDDVSSHWVRMYALLFSIMARLLVPQEDVHSCWTRMHTYGSLHRTRILVFLCGKQTCWLFRMSTWTLVRQGHMYSCWAMLHVFMLDEEAPMHICTAIIIVFLSYPLLNSSTRKAASLLISISTCCVAEHQDMCQLVSLFVFVFQPIDLNMCSKRNIEASISRLNITAQQNCWSPAMHVYIVYITCIYYTVCWTLAPYVLYI